MKKERIKVLMFGWEFPPHISGGLGTACHGLTKSLTEKGTEILFVIPKAYGDEELKMVNASELLISDSDNTLVAVEGEQKASITEVEVIAIQSAIKPYISREMSETFSIENWNYEFPSENLVNQQPVVRRAKKYKFSGAYGPQLLEEVKSYSQVAGAIARHYSFDVIHAHDWLTYQAGTVAREVSGKPLITHVHSTEFDRTAKIDSKVFAIEQDGMKSADHIVAVSHWTKKTIVSNYGIPENKVSVVHNGILERKDPGASSKARHEGNQIVTFLGRITYQKGPKYFVEAARKVLLRLPNVHFVMAGSGDLMPAMIELVARYRLSTRFHFTGFMKGKQVDQVWGVSDLYVMPSVSEPFGIAPLEAIQSGVPVIISKQSGVAEVMPHAIKVDFWNSDSLANAIYHVLKHKSLSDTLKAKSKQAIKQITWDKAAQKINDLYYELIPTN